MKVRSIDFVEIHVADMERSLAFYRDTLGVAFPLSGQTGIWKELDSPPVALAFGQGPQPPGSVVIALGVEDLEGAVEELRAKGVPIVSEIREQDVCPRAIIAALDGNTIMLHRRKDGSAG